MQVDVPLSSMGLNLFVEGRQNWLEEGFLVPVNKRRRIVEEGSPFVAQNEGGATHEANKQPWKDSNATTI